MLRNNNNVVLFINLPGHPLHQAGFRSSHEGVCYQTSCLRLQSAVTVSGNVHEDLGDSLSGITPSMWRAGESSIRGCSVYDQSITSPRRLHPCPNVPIDALRSLSLALQQGPYASTNILPAVVKRACAYTQDARFGRNCPLAVL